MQLAAIERNAVGKALVADVKAKNLDASPVDLLRIVKARCRRCAPLSVRGCPIGPRSAPHAGVLDRPWTHAAEYGLAPLSTLEYYLACRRVSWHHTVLLRARC